ncbi:MAG: VWA domain-containing protein, partial [Actinomycetota bacterium]
MTTAIASSPEEMAVSFARILRGVGLQVPLDSVLTFVNALDVVSLDSRSDVFWAGRSTLVRRPEDHQLFDRAFAVFWEHRTSGETDDELPPRKVSLLIDDETESDPNAGEYDSNPSIHLRFSASEALRKKDFAQYDDTELAEAQRLMQALRFAGPPRRSLRLTTAKRNGSRHDLRRTVRASISNGGEPMRLHWKEPSDRLRRIVVLLDISGSMEPYARALLRFMHAAVAGRQRVEAFAFGTRLTRLTKELRSRDPDKAIKRAAE